jgi:predicted RNA-binding Zn-ribbon protein involved in translation (DUF1610 family)
MEKEEILKNYEKPPLMVEHKKLERFSSESIFRSKCPNCEDGILLMARDQKTGKILEEDVCISCGRRVRYLDIKDFENM